MVEAKATKVKTKKGDQIYLVDPNDLIPYENNPRVNDEAVDYLVKSIKEARGPNEPLEKGFRDPIEVNQDFVIICGHTRQKAALKLKLKYVPVIIHTFETPEAEKLYRLTNNKASEKAWWDDEKLSLELEPLEDLYDLEDLDFFTEDTDAEDSEDAEPEAEPEIYTGDAQEKSEYSLLLIFATEMAQKEAYKKLVDEGYIVRKL